MLERATLRRFKAEWFALFALQLLAVALFIANAHREHAALQALEAERLQVQARVVDDNLIRQLEGAGKALAGIAADASIADPARDNRLLGSKLKLLTDAMPGVSSMFVLDGAGIIAASSRDDLVGTNFSRRDYFDVPRRGRDPAALYVSPPFTTMRGTWVVVLSRALVDSRQRFLGVVTATLDPDYFNVILRSVLYAPDMRATLTHRDGKVFLAVPGASAPHVAATMEAGRTIDRADLHLDKPLFVSVSRDVASVFEAWRQRIWQLGTLLALLAVGPSAALMLNQQRRRALFAVEEAAARDRHAAAERVEIALRGADLGLWDLHVPSDRFVINGRERALLGYADDDELPQGAQWRELIHPNDRALVNAAIVPHLKGREPNYGCEHRMRHKAGHYVWLSSHGMIVARDAAGAPLRIVGTHLDITERKTAHERLAQSAALLQDSEEQLRLVTDHMPALVSRLDLQQRFRFANRAYADWLHLDRTSLPGRSLHDVYGDAAYSRFRHHIEHALAGNEVSYERELATPNGPRHVHFTLVPQRGRDGAVNGLYTLATDITERHNAALYRARIEERLSLALEGSGLALFDWDIANGTIYHSAQAAEMRGDLPLESTGPVAGMQQYVHADDLLQLLAQMKAAVVGTVPLLHAEFRLKRNAGDWLWVRARGRVAQRDAAGRALRLAGTYADVNDRKIAEGRLRRLAEFDTLTGLPNRALFHDRLRQAMARAARGKPMALLFLDIDHFKGVNDSLGHEAGDKLLQALAARMQGAVRESDTVARLAGDEFTVILEGLRDAGDAKMLAQKLVELLRQPVPVGEHSLQVSVSIGVAVCVPGERDEAALVRRADAALYVIKRRGRNGFHCEEPAQRAEPIAASD